MRLQVEDLTYSYGEKDAVEQVSVAEEVIDLVRKYLELNNLRDIENEKV